MARRTGNLRFGILFLAFAIALFLWGMAHGASDVEQGFDVPIELSGLDDQLVVTDMSVDAINVRLRASRAAMRNVKASNLVYRLDVTDSKVGTAEYEVEQSTILDELPRDAQIVARSPSHVQLRFERKGRKAVGVRADVEGDPADGHLVAAVEVTPRRVWLAGARSQVLRLREVVTETIDVTGATEPIEREVRLFLGGGTVWMEDKKPVVVRVEIIPDPEKLAVPEATGELTPQQEEG
ncbi:MAG: CdaR family protein [Myxococcota bacterium]